MRRLLVTVALVIAGSVTWAQDTSNQDNQETEVVPEVQTEEPMTVERLGQIVQAVDPEAVLRGTAMELTIEDIPIIVITDPVANRMRAMVPIRSADGLTAEEMMRLMQANFDSALDARYAVARGRLWGVFIHPLAELEREQFLSALIQTVNLARTYGGAYSGGAMTFGGGDSNGIFRDLFEELKKRGEEI
ncbi:MAG: hypothetical protein ABJ246_05415 [Paracoccaceae bacterium]